MADRIATTNHHDGNGARRDARRLQGHRAAGQNHVYLQLDEFLHLPRQPVGTTIGVAILEQKVAARGLPEFAHAIAKPGARVGVQPRWCGAKRKHADPGQCSAGRLRTQDCGATCEAGRGNRPDKATAIHSTTFAREQRYGVIQRAGRL